MEQKFTQMAQEALSDAVQNAAALGNPQVDTLHLLDAMLRQENSTARTAQSANIPIQTPTTPQPSMIPST